MDNDLSVILHRVPFLDSGAIYTPARTSKYQGITLNM